MPISSNGYPATYESIRFKTNRPPFIILNFKLKSAIILFNFLPNLTRDVIKKPRQQKVTQIAKRAIITFLAVLMYELKTSITVEITDSIIENLKSNKHRT